MSWDNFPENWEKDVQTIKVLDEDRIPQNIKIGETYHTSWQNSKRYSFKLLSHGDIWCKLKSAFGREFNCKITDLRETNKRALQNASKRIKNYEKSKTRLQ